MNVQINSVHFDASEQLQDFVNKKVNKLERFFERITQVEVYLKLGKPDAKSNKQVEIKLFVPNHEMFAVKEADTFEEATDLTIDALRKQIVKYKEKNI